jgi:dienelactone hydrolase
MSAPGLGGWGYSIYVPEDYRGDEPFPLLVYLAGGQGRPVQAVAGAQATISTLGYLVALPQADGYWWTERSTRVVTALLDELLRQFNVDTNRVYLSGFSNGGTGTIHFASLWPHRLAAASSLMGAGAFPPQGEAPLLINLAQLPTQWLHGRRDEVIPWQTTRDSVLWLERVAPGAPFDVHYLKRGHDLWLGNDEGLLLPFLEQQRRDPFPREVLLQLRELSHPRRFWVEVLEKGPGTAEVQGRIENDNTIVIKTRRVRKLRLLLRRELLPIDGAPFRVVLDGRTVYSGPLVPECGRIRQSWGESADPFLAYSAELVFDLTGDH